MRERIKIFTVTFSRDFPLLSMASGAPSASGNYPLISPGSFLFHPPLSLSLPSHTHTDKGIGGKRREGKEKITHTNE